MDFREFVRGRLPALALAREPEIIDELAQHLSDVYEEARADGLTHDEAFARAAAVLPAHPDDLAAAIRSAARALPGVIADRWRTALDEADPRPAGGWSMVADLRRDVRYAMRTLARTPGIAAVIVVTFALGIGANAAIFSAVDALLLRSAPVANPDRLVAVYTAAADGAARYGVSSPPDYRDLAASGVLDGLLAYASIPLTLDVGGATEAIAGEIVSGNYFHVLGVRLPLGRPFAAEEDRPGSPVRVVVLADALWRKHFGSDPAVIGRTVTLNGNAYTVIGVAPREFRGPTLGRAAEAWVPLALQPEVRQPSAGLRRSLGHSNLLDARGLRWLNMIGRLRADSTIAGAGAALDAVSRRLEAEHPATNRGRYSVVVALGEGPGVRTSSRPLLRLLGGAVTLVLLIACANVASLLLARAVSRRREVAVRMAIGAGRARLVRQCLTEAVLLAAIGAAGGLVIAWWAAPLLHLLGIPESIDLGLSGRLLVFSLLTAVAAGVLAGLAPVLQTLRRDTMAALRDEGGAVATGSQATRMRAVFVTLQVALSLVLLVGAGLFLRTLQNAYAVDLGYAIDRTLLVDINLDVRGYSQEAGQGVYTRILDGVAALPGVTAVGAARVTVLSGGARTTTISVDGRPVAEDGSNGMDARVNVVSRGYLDAMGIPLIQGRRFGPQDAAQAPRVAIVSQSLAQRLWKHTSPIGQRLGANELEVIGVMPDAVYRSVLERNPPPYFYLPLEQNYESGVTLHIRTASDPLALIPSVRHLVRAIDSQLVVGRPRTLRDEFTSSIADQRMMATMVGLFGAVALLLAAVGLYGTLSHMAGQRTAEIGIRLALGARPASILSMIVLRGLRLTAIGAVIGLGAAFVATRYVQSQLFGVRATDAVTFVSVGIVLAAAAILACLVPARRAMRVDPVIALRNT